MSASRIMSRRIDCCALLTGSSIRPASREHLRPFHSDQTYIDPSRVDDRDVYRWLFARHLLRAAVVRGCSSHCGLSLVLRPRLDGAVADHSTFSKKRHDCFRDRDLLRELFDTTIALHRRGAGRRRVLCRRCRHDVVRVEAAGSWTRRACVCFRCQE